MGETLTVRSQYWFPHMVMWSCVLLLGRIQGEGKVKDYFQIHCDCGLYTDLGDWSALCRTKKHPSINYIPYRQQYRKNVRNK